MDNSAYTRPLHTQKNIYTNQFIGSTLHALLNITKGQSDCWFIPTILYS